MTRLYFLALLFALYGAFPVEAREALPPAPKRTHITTFPGDLRVEASKGDLLLSLSGEVTYRVFLMKEKDKESFHWCVERKKGANDDVITACYTHDHFNGIALTDGRGEDVGYLNFKPPYQLPLAHSGFSKPGDAVLFLYPQDKGVLRAMSFREGGQPKMYVDRYPEEGRRTAVWIIGE